MGADDITCEIKPTLLILAQMSNRWFPPFRTDFGTKGVLEDLRLPDKFEIYPAGTLYHHRKNRWRLCCVKVGVYSILCHCFNVVYHGIRKLFLKEK